LPSSDSPQNCPDPPGRRPGAAGGLARGGCHPAGRRPRLPHPGRPGDVWFGSQWRPNWTFSSSSWRFTCS